MKGNTSLNLLERKMVLVLGLGILCPHSGEVFAAEKGLDVIVGCEQRAMGPVRALIKEAGGEVQRSFHLIPAFAAKIPDGSLSSLRANPNVVYVHEDHVMMAFEGGAEYDNVWNVTHVGAELVHSNGNLGYGVSVAVLDTGIDYTHEDLNDNYMGGYDFVFDDSDPMDDAYNGHGTHVAGTIGAELNGAGVVGVAPGVFLYAVKVLDGSTFGLESDVIAGIQWAVDNQMDVANLSLGVATDSEALRQASDAAYQSGLLLVAAAGNNYGGAVAFPAAYDSVIAVSGTTSSDQVIYISSLGPEIELAAPGADIYSTVPGGGYDFLGGTSQAAPHVSGVAALLMAGGVTDLNGDGLADQIDVRLDLQQLAYDLGDPGRDNSYGFGLVRASDAFDPAESTPTPTPEPTPVPTPEPPTEIDLLLIKHDGPAPDSAQSAEISDGLFDVAIENQNLKGITYKVMEGGIVIDELSGYRRFSKRTGQTFDFSIDATATTLELVFTPYGTTDSSASIQILEQF